MIRLSRLDQITGPARRPGYEPARHGTGIVHLGIGAFHRAHQAVVTDEALAASGGDWRITGISLRSTAVAEALTPQNGLYTVISRAASGPRARVIGAVAGVIAADPQASLAALAAPATRIVTLTVTEKGYGLDPVGGGADLDLPAHRADLARPGAPASVLGLLVEALHRRRSAGLPGLALLSCDNLPGNGHLLQRAVLDFARAREGALADWIADQVRFPASMVDRITPAPTEATRAEAAALTGCHDAAAVEAEDFLQWVIQEDFPLGRPAWEAGGALFVADVTPYEQMKLTMLNGSHSLLAYAGVVAGHRYVRDTLADPALSRLIARHMAAAAALLPPLPGLDLADYAGALQRRFANPAIAHETRQIAMDGTQKLPQRIFAPALLARARGHDPATFAFATAAWLRHLEGRADDGTPTAIADPRAEALRRLSGPAAAAFDAMAALPGFLPPALAQDPLWRAAVVSRLARMQDQGMRAAIAAEIAP